MVRRLLGFALRAAAWRTTPNPPLLGLPALLGFALGLAVLRIALQFAESGTWHTFNPYGLNAVVAWIAVEVAVAALFVPPAGRATALSVMIVFSMVGDVAATALRAGLPIVAPALVKSETWASTIPITAIYVVGAIWWAGAMACVIGSLEWRMRLPLVGRVIGLGLALFAADAVLPHMPVFLPPHFEARDANWWEVLYALHRRDVARAGSAVVAKVETAQPALLQSELSAMAPERGDATDFYALGIAGWADQDVFAKELDGGLESIASVLPIRDHIVRLINRRETLETLPLADLANFQAAVHGIGAVMDKDKDVLVLFMTSHGGKTGFALELPGQTAELTPQQVADALNGEGIKNRIVIVSACFSGIFVPPLQNDTTIVLTAADANNTSFGCAPERDWTYFGDAFFRQSLHPGSDFENAFEHARILIQGWELMDHLQPSNPQGFFGPALVQKLAPALAAAQSAGR